MIATAIASLGNLNSSTFNYYYVNLFWVAYNCNWDKKDIVINKKDKKYNLSIYYKQNYKQLWQ